MYRYLLIFLFGFAIFAYGSNRQGYRESFDTNYWQSVYDHSQYCVPRCEFRGNIDDPELYTLAGLSYVSGEDPSVINPEVQPLTKYLYGLSTLLFGNALFVQLAFMLGSLYVLYQLTILLLPSIWALLPLVLLSIDPLILDQLKRPFVDLSVMFYLLLIVYFLVSSRYKRDWWWGALALGALSASKSFSLGIFAGTVMFFVFYCYDKKQFYKHTLRVFSLSILFYLFAYLPYFLHGHTLIDFFKLHLDIIRLYRSYVPEYPKAEIFRIIFTGQWRTWWGDKGLIPSPFFTPLWAISTLSLPLAFLYPLKKSEKSPLQIIILVCVVWLLFISLRLVFPRYLLPILPLLYIVLSLVLSRIIPLWHSRFFRSTSKPIVI